MPTKRPLTPPTYAERVEDLVGMLAPPKPGEDVSLWRSRVTTKYLLPALADSTDAGLDGGEAIRVAALDSIAPRRP